MIRSFRCKETKELNDGYGSRRFQGIEMAARTRLARLEAATSLQDLARIQGNRLEALKDDRKGQYRIRINQQWRICFRWTERGAEDVEIVDYH